MKNNNVKKGIMLVAFAAMSTMMVGAHPRPCPPPAARAKVVVVKKAPKKVETVVVKKGGKTMSVNDKEIILAMRQSPEQGIRQHLSGRFVPQSIIRHY